VAGPAGPSAEIGESAHPGQLASAKDLPPNTGAWLRWGPVIDQSPEWAANHSIGRLWAEYDIIARMANEERYVPLVAASGLTPSQTECVRASEAWGPLMAAFREAEACGLDLNRAVTALVQGRTISSADDIAAVLHGRIIKWIKSVGNHQEPERIVGLFSAATGVGEHDMVQALEDRRTLIEQRTRSLALDAIKNRQPWALQFGQPPADHDRREEWLRLLDNIAAYRDRWKVNTRMVLGGEPRSSEQMAHRQSAQLAALRALEVSPPTERPRDMPTPSPVMGPESADLGY
jgi:hypothetical protein